MKESRTGGRKTGRGRTLTHRAELRDVFSSVSRSRLIQDSEAGRTGDWIRTLFCPLRFGVSRGGHIMRTMHGRARPRGVREVQQALQCIAPRTRHHTSKLLSEMSRQQCTNQIQGRAKEMSPCLKIPTPVLLGNLAIPCTANQPISEILGL